MEMAEFLKFKEKIGKVPWILFLEGKVVVR